MRGKILVVTPYFYPEAGGVANHTYNLYKNISDEKTSVVIVTSGNNKLIFEEKIEGMKVYRLPTQFKISNTPINFKWKKQIKEIIRKENPEIIMAHTPVPFISDMALFASKSMPFVLKYHHGGSMVKGGFFQKMLLKIYEATFLKYLFNKSKKIISASDFVSNNFMKEYICKTITITPGVDIHKFKPKKSNNKNKVLFVANLKKSEEYKGLNYLLEAISIIKKNIKDIELIIIGDGDNKKYYEEKCKKLGIQKNIVFKGRLNGKKLIREYQNATILVLPSLIDNFPNVLLEAMACKKPIIGTNIGGIPEILNNDENGFLIPPKDSKSIAKAIIKILNNPRLAKKMGENGYRKIKENFTWNKKARETKKVINQILKQNEKTKHKK